MDCPWRIKYRVFVRRLWLPVPPRLSAGVVLLLVGRLLGFVGVTNREQGDLRTPWRSSISSAADRRFALDDGVWKPLAGCMLLPALLCWLWVSSAVVRGASLSLEFDVPAVQTHLYPHCNTFVLESAWRATQLMSTTTPRRRVKIKLLNG